MSCLTVTCSRLGDGISASSSRIGEGVTASASLLPVAEFNVGRIGEGIEAYVSLMGERLTGLASRIGEGIKATVSIICSLEEFVAFLNVSPDEVQWITDDIGVFFEVESNVEWIVVN